MMQRRWVTSAWFVLVMLCMAGFAGASWAVVKAVRSHPARVEAVAVSGRAVTALSSDACDRGRALKLRLRWHGKPVTAAYLDPPCNHSYRPGDLVNVFVASNDVENVGPDADWIMHPDEHDPFEFLGPNDLRPFVIVVGSVAAFLTVALGGFGARMLTVSARNHQPDGLT